MAESKVSDEPIVDTGGRYRGYEPSQIDIEGHRSQRAIYIGVHLPTEALSNSSHRRRRHRRPQGKSGDKQKRDLLSGISEDEEKAGAADPSQHVMFLLGEEEEGDETHQLFCEMDEFVLDTGDGCTPCGGEWKETARWIKFEEDVEEGGERWSKPHVATLSLFSLFEVRNCLATGVILLNADAVSLEQITELILNKVISEGKLNYELRDKVQEMLLRRHSHLHDKKHKMTSKGSQLPLIRSLADIGRKYSSKDVDKAPFIRRISELQSQPVLSKCGSVSGMEKSADGHETPDIHASPSSAKFDLHFMKKIPPGAETSNILVGETDFLPTTLAVFVRLKEAIVLGELTEVPVPTRFLFILLGPQGNAIKFHEMGRSMATVMSDEVFHDVAYKARNRDDLLAGIDEFLSSSTVLPPGEWDPTIRIEPPASVPSQDSRKAPSVPNGASNQVGQPASQHKGGGEEHEDHADPTLVRTGRLFGGLIEDIKRRAPHYASDFRDAIHIQCFASFFFLYFACLTPIITFGGLLVTATGGYLGAIESILAGAIVGIVYALFAGQPLTILGSTGPVLVFEQIVYSMATTYGWNYLSFRMWIGLWVALMLLIVVAFDLSALVRYITRFTEESFACLIALIFIKEAIIKCFDISHDYPVNTNWVPMADVDRNCSCAPKNRSFSEDYILQQAQLKNPVDLPPTIKAFNVTSNSTYDIGIDWANISTYYFTWDTIRYQKRCKNWGGHWVKPSGVECPPVYMPDVFFFSILLFIGTFAVAYALKGLRNSRFFPNKMRVLISDFAVMIAISSMTLLDALVGFHTPHLDVPASFEPTLGYKRRSWIVPLLGGNPVYTIFIALGPALLAVILIFMDQQITAVIVNRKENKLKKGSGYHLDMLIVALLIAVNSILGIPWFVAATVLSINHVMSLKKESENTAPGERPVFLGCREQRVTGVAIFLTIGLSVFLMPVLKYIPMAVLYGVFLYMGVSSLNGVQLVQRLFLFVMPPKYQPDYIYLRYVPLWRVHIFTLIQAFCLALLWGIKSIKKLSIGFPLMVLAMCFIRKALEKVFTQHELKWLDDIMPESKKREEDDLKKAGDEEGADGPDNGADLPLTDMVDTGKREEKQINISDEMSKTSIWRQLTGASSNKDSPDKKKKKKHKSEGSRHSKSRGGGGDVNKKAGQPEEADCLLEAPPQIVINPPSTHGSPETQRRGSAGNPTA